ncbi:hypothetical protein OG746_26435 [Streptomyces sp. NBC_01016]|uniref:hypothetical protein n=1 Tax=Streptomyces sp. NBC_01016 TaxID=2903720 RepID=UPI00224E3FF2|nr:hypothetical protein [Streptomyces sp. NBC_01016]MCX4832282.1 hypothetical protein [Streptomyces sp. NBC_01016]
MANLHLKMLKCIETEDWVGHDDPKLAVNGQNILLPSMSGGQKYAIDEYHAFDDEVTITLHEADGLPGDRSDLLGSHTLTEEGSGILNFTKDGANYQLSYTLTRS